MARPEVLRLRVRILPDGRFRVAYSWLNFWSVFPLICHEYFNTEEEVEGFISKLLKNTKWRFSD